MMQEMDLEVTSEFLVMAAYLLSLKSRMLLPQQHVKEDEDEGTQLSEEDPRWELTQRLIEYQRYKEAAKQLHKRYLEYQQIFFNPRPVCNTTSKNIQEELLEVDLYSLISCFIEVLKRKEPDASMEIIMDDTTILHRMEEIEYILKNKGKVSFFELIRHSFKKIELIVTLLAILELIKLNKIIAKQEKAFADIWIFQNNNKQ
jgi:segregation and condensation protein A